MMVFLIIRLSPLCARAQLEAGKHQRPFVLLNGLKGTRVMWRTLNHAS
jgi:hypothetical protein